MVVSCLVKANPGGEGRPPEFRHSQLTFIRSGCFARLLLALTALLALLIFFLALLTASGLLIVCHFNLLK